MLFERPPAGRRALLVHVRFSAEDETERLAELTELAHSADMTVASKLTARRRAPHPRWFVGTGKLEEIAAEVRDHQIDVLVVNHELSPGQQRNLETHLNCGVLTRTELILTIFADRARTHEGQLQVELAQCRHAQTRLVRGWTHLDRQKGGVGLRGAGETQLELDQRMLDERIKSIQKKLERVRARRAQGRRRRARAQMATVVLVGYTNAGKSTLFNALTTGGAEAEDRLFATLDPTMRQLDLPGVGHVVLADTVGFIRDLPHSLVEAFKATLEEVSDADLLLQVIDGADANAAEHIDQVTAVLLELEAADVPLLRVFNKSDLIPAITGAVTTEPAYTAPLAGDLCVSAHTGAGLNALREAIATSLGHTLAEFHIQLSPAQGRVRAWLHELDAVRAEQPSEEGGWCLTVQLDETGQRRLASEQVRVAGSRSGS